jgi:3D (Asp-Asp-Asp) domain-containing protein
VTAGVFAFCGDPVSQAEPAPVAVTVCVDGQAIPVLTEAETVGELLADLEISLGDDDRCIPPPHATLADGVEVEVTRVSVETVEREREVAPPVIARYDRRVGRTIVLHPGSPGKVRELVRIWRKDGRVTSEEVIEKTTLAAAVPQRIVRGSRSLSSRGSVRTRRSLSMIATAYDPGPASCGRYASGWTAIGMKAGKGVVAVDPRVIPLGTKLYIDGYGSAVAGDVGRAIKGHRIDLGFDTRAEALRWGRRRVTVYVVE